VKSFHQEQSPEALGVGVTNYNISAMKHMTTGLMVNIGEFEEYQFNGSDDNENSHEELVVCSKELRAMLSYCEVTVTPFFLLYYTAGGKPIKLSSGDDGTGVKVDIVLATLETKKGAGNTQLTHSQGQSQGAQRRVQPQEALETEVAGMRNGNDPSHSTGQEPADKQQGQNQQHQQMVEERDDQGVLLGDDDLENGPFSDITPEDRHAIKERVTNSTRNIVKEGVTNSSRNIGDESKDKPVRRRLKRLLDSSSDED